MNYVLRHLSISMGKIVLSIHLHCINAPRLLYIFIIEPFKHHMHLCIYSPKRLRDQGYQPFISCLQTIHLPVITIDLARKISILTLLFYSGKQYQLLETLKLRTLLLHTRQSKELLMYICQLRPNRLSSLGIVNCRAFLLHPRQINMWHLVMLGTALHGLSHNHSNITHK